MAIVATRASPFPWSWCFVFCGIFLIIYCTKEVDSIKCIHEEITKLAPKSLVIPQSDESGESTSRRRNINGRSNIRIYLDTTRLDTVSRVDINYTCFSSGQVITTQSGSSYSCQDADILTEAKSNFLRNSILSRGKLLLESALSVDNIQGNLTLTPTLSCYASNVVRTYPPPEWTTAGDGLPDTDLVMFVTARKVMTDGVFAFAGECASGSDGRAIAGYLNFNPSSVSSSVGSDYALNFGAAIHEMTHVLGFSASKYAAFRYPNGTIIPKSEVVFDSNFNNIRGSVKIRTPRVVEWARNHYGCGTIDGVELENQGGNGTSQSHWERRMVLNEYMTGSTSDFPVFSPLTLAFLEDSGWYTANYSTATPLSWGWKQGCAFAQQSCTQWEGENYFCRSASATSCNFDRSAKSQCNIRTYDSDIQNIYQYFTSPNIGGGDVFADYCPYYWANTRNGYCTDTTNSGSGLIDSGDKYCENCRCFDSSLVKNSPSGTLLGQGCYETYCTSSETLKVRIGPYWYNCGLGETLKDIGSYSGKLVCPNNNVLCIGAKNDTTWPEFTSIDPTGGGPSQFVVIKGKNFVEGMNVIINEPANDCQFIDNETYHCNVADQSAFTNPAHLFGTDQDVVLVIPGSDKSCVGPNAYRLKVSFNAGLFIQLGNWMKNNPIISAVVIGGGVLCCLLCCFCCYRERKRMQKRKRGAA